MSDIRVVLACGDYDRTRALHAKTVPTPGLDLHCLALPAAETFVRMTTNGDIDVAEFSASMYGIGLTRGDDRFIAVPVFPLRAFRHRDIYVRVDGDVREPTDLVGRRIGVRHFHMTSAVWQRGILAEDFGVRTEQIHWVRAELAAPGPVHPRITLQLPESIKISTTRSSSLVDLVLSGSISAAFVASPIYHPGLRRLFADPVTIEKDYFVRAGYPIMHLLAVRRRLVEQYPQLPGLLIQAFENAKRAAYAAILGSSSASLLPFAALELEQAQAMFGVDLYPYGLVEANLRPLETLRRYLAEQHLAPGAPPIAEWFSPDVSLSVRHISTGAYETED